jgi:hypothetical protein
MPEKSALHENEGNQGQFAERPAIDGRHRPLIFHPARVFLCPGYRPTTGREPGAPGSVLGYHVVAPRCVVKSAGNPV